MLRIQVNKNITYNNNNKIDVDLSSFQHLKNKYNISVWITQINIICISKNPDSYDMKLREVELRSHTCGKLK